MPEAARTTLKVHVWDRTLWSDHRLVAPVAQLDHAALGSEAGAERALVGFLEKYFRVARADDLARANLPDPRVHTVEVPIPRRDLGRRLQWATPLEIAAIVVPEGDDAWVVVPALDHTFFVPRGEDLDAALRSEIVRTAVVLQDDPMAYLDLLPPQDAGLEVLEIALDAGAGGALGAKAKRDLVERRARAEAREVLRTVARPLHASPHFTDGPPPVGLDDATQRVTTLLTAAARTSVLLVGAPRAGKSSVLWATLRAARADARPQIWGTSGAQLIAGMSGLGQWQARVQRVMEAAERLDAIVYFDDVQDLFNDRSHGIDLVAAIRPYMEDNRVRVVAEVAPSALDRLEKRNVAFFAAMARVRVEAQDAAAARTAVQRRADFDAAADEDAPDWTGSALDAVIELTARYFPERPFPAKAVRLFDAVGDYVTSQGGDRRIETNDVLEAFSLESGIPPFLLRDDAALRAEEVRAGFAQHLIGQQEAVRAVVDTICVVKAALQPTGKPLATFLFVGPTGVGKTALARALARFVFGSEDRLVRFDMSEFSDPISAERLIRADGKDGLLTRAVRQQPFSVLLLDEIEKADRAVFDLLLQVTGEGRLTDAGGRTTYFHNALIVLTSNLGAAHRRDGLGFDGRRDVDADYYLRQVEQAFRPEFVNRLDRIIAFAPLTAEQMSSIVRLQLDKLSTRRGIVERGLQVQVSDAAMEKLARDGYHEAYGARAMRRHLDDAVVSVAARLLARVGQPARGGTLDVRLDDEPAPQGRVLGRLSPGGLRLAVLEGQQRQARRDVMHVQRVATLRREVDRYLALDRVDQLRGQLELVQAQLNVGGQGSAKARRRARKKDRRKAEDLQNLSVDFHRLQEVLQRARQARDALVTVEEIGLVGLLSQEETVGFASEADAAYRTFRRNLAYLLLALENDRDEATVLLRRVGPSGGYALWLEPLAAQLEARGWRAELHAPGTQARPEERWPTARAWPPGRPLRTSLERTAGALSEAPALLLRVEGPYAGVLLALEKGRHVFERRGAHDATPELHVQLLCRRTTLTDKEWAGQGTVLDPLDASRVRKLKPARRHAFAHDRLHIERAGVVLNLPLRDYWARFEEVAVMELLRFEADEAPDRDPFLAGTLEGGTVE